MKSIRVIGLSDVERHALNSVVRLSVGRNPSYTIWQTGDGRPDILFLDASHVDAQKVAQSNRERPDHILWLGQGMPDYVHHQIQRPIAWAHLLEKMDAIIVHNAPTMPPSDFAASAIPTASAPGPALTGQHPAGSDTNTPIALSDFNVSGTGQNTRSAPILYLQGDDTLGRAPDKRKRVLIVDANTQFRLYLKAVLSVGNDLLVEETGNLQDALTMVQELAYDSVLIDQSFPADGAARLCKSILSSAMNLRPGDTRISRPHVFFLSQSSNAWKRLQARRIGAGGILIRPRNQEQLDTLFAAVNRYAQG